MTKKKQSYSAKFKAQAVEKTADNNGNLSATTRQLGMAMQTLVTSPSKKYSPDLNPIEKKWAQANFLRQV